jgi:peptidoglycan hydrolase-like protein with peptidoglycan-binding domain
METFADLLPACADESLEIAKFAPSPSNGFTWKKFSGTALTRVLSLMVSLSILSLASAAMALMQQGDRGPAVSTLQAQLQSAGCSPGAIDGVFGAQTAQAVRCFQLQNRLTVDGRVGSQTEALLSGQAVPIADQPSTSPAGGLSATIVRPGDSGKDVETLQARLKELNYLELTTGYFGPSTVTAVKRFQGDRGLTQDGVVGAQTIRALGLAPVASVPNYPQLPPPSGYVPPMPPGSETVVNQPALRVGSSGLRVEELQNRLKAMGYFDGPVTGYYGSITQDAVMRYQRARGLSATGVADSNTLNLMAQSKASRRFVVVVPRESKRTLDQVRAVVPNAMPEKSRLGEFVNAGSFFDRETADRQSAFLRGRGLDARVAYR